VAEGAEEETLVAVLSKDGIFKKVTPVRDKKSQIKVGNLAIYLYLYS
jgi:hypothetical protein